MGERLTRLPDLAPLPCLFVFPPFPIRTAAIYAGLGPTLTSEGKISKIMRFLESGDFGLLENDLERVIFRAHPELERWKTFFRERGALVAQVSGSGSAGGAEEAPRHDGRPSRGDAAAGGLLG